MPDSAAEPRRRSRRRLRFLMFAATAAVLTGAVLGAYAGGVFRDLELDTVDARFSVRGDKEVPDEVVVVAIDDVSFGELQQRWPFPRRFFARSIDRLKDAGAKVIAYDVQFTEPSESEADDNALIESIARAGNVLLATTEVGKGGSTSVLGGDDVLKDVGAEAVSGQYPNDPGGVLRRTLYDDHGLKTLAVRAAERFDGRRVTRASFDDDNTAWIDYVGPPRSVKSFSFSRVVNGKVPASEFRGKIVVVGPVAPSLQDVHTTSTSGDDLMAGARGTGQRRGHRPRGIPARRGPRGSERASDRTAGAGRSGGGDPVGAAALRPRRGTGSDRLPRGGPARLQLGTHRVVRLSAALPRDRGGRRSRHLGGRRRVRTRARTGSLLPVRARGGGGRGTRERGRGPAAGRHQARRDGAVQRRARLHDVLGDARPRRGDRGAQPLPHGDERRGRQAPGRADLLHG